MKTSVTLPQDIKREWYVIDVAGKVLGRVATQVAILLMGKNKSNFANNIDMGDNVIVINAADVAVTGNKMTDKKYYSHSGFPGGFKERTFKQVIEKNPDFIIRNAVKGMLPNNKLRATMIARLHVFAGAEHDKDAQQPKEYKISKK